MESKNQVLLKKKYDFSKAQASNALSKVALSTLAQSSQLENASLVQRKTYDSQYRQGFPKVYSIENQDYIRSRQSLDDKGKYSFRNDYSHIVDQNSLLLKENNALKQEVTKMTAARQPDQKSSYNQSQIDRLTRSLIERENQIKILNQKLFTFNSQAISAQQSANNYHESQIIHQLNLRIESLTQQIRTYEQQPKNNEGLIRHYENQISQLIQNLRLSEGQISHLNLKIKQHQNDLIQTKNLLGQSLTQTSQQKGQLNVNINQYVQKINSYESQLSQYDEVSKALRKKLQQSEIEIKNLSKIIAQYKEQINSLTTQMNQHKSQVIRVQGSDTNSNSRSATISNPENGEPKHKISLLTQKIQSYEMQVQQYQKTVNQYQSQIKGLQQINSKLQQKLSRDIQKKSAPAETFPSIPTQITKQELQYQIKKQYKKTINNDAQIQEQVYETKSIIEQGKMTLKVLILLEEINRLKQKEEQLTYKAEQLHMYLLKAENYIEQIQSQLEKNNLKQNIPAHILEKMTHLEQENARFALIASELQTKLYPKSQINVSQEYHLRKMALNELRIIMMLQQINRLNQKVSEYKQYLIHAQDHIEQIQQALKSRDPIIPPQISQQITFLSQQNQKLNQTIANLRIQIQRSEHFNVKQEFPQQSNKFASVLQENARLNRLVIELQQQSKIETATRMEQKIQDRIPEDFKLKLQSVEQENAKLNQLVLELQNSRADSLWFQVQYSKAKLGKIILLSQIERLNYEVKTIHGYLMNAEIYIEQTQNRLAELNEQTNVAYRIPSELQEQLFSVSQQNQRLSNLLQQIQNNPSRIQTKVQQKIEFQASSSPEVQLRINQLVSQNQRLEAWLKSVEEASILREARLQFKSLILLSEINRLNFVSRELEGYLIKANQYIMKIENGQVDPNTMLEIEIMNLRGENQKIYAELTRISHLYGEQVAKYQEEIKILTAQGYQLLDLQRAYQQSQIERNQILEHLRGAEEYISQLREENESLLLERENLLQQLNQRGESA